MSKKENNAELELILEQLKKSYGEDSDVNNSISDEENDEFDDFGKRLSELLSQNYSEEQPSQSLYSFDMNLLTDFEDENENFEDLESIVETESVAETEEIEVSELTEEAEEVEDIQAIEEIEEIEDVQVIEEVEEVEDVQVIEEVEEVEDVQVIEEVEDSETSEDSEITSKSPIIDIDAEFIKLGIPLVKEKNNTSTFYNDLPDKSDGNSDTNVSESNEEVDGVFDKMFANSSEQNEQNVSYSDKISAAKYETSTLDTVEDKTVKHEPAEADTVKNNFVEYVEDNVIEDVNEDVNVKNEIVEETSDVQILEIENEELKVPTYTLDPLQGRLSDRLKFSKRHALSKPIPIYEESQKDDDDSDISVLLDVGEETDLDIAENNSPYYTAKQRKNKKYLFGIFGNPDLPYGYCGDEFTSKEQVEEIKNKYNADKRGIFIRLSGVAVISLILIFLELFFAFGNIENHAVFPTLEIIFMSLICGLSYPELWKEIKRIMKLDPGIYSASVITLVSFYVYNISVLAIIGMSDIQTEKFPLFGFCAALFTLCALISEYTSCLRESATFDTLTSDDVIYTAEKFNSGSIRAFSKNNAVSVKRAETIKGYFKRISDSDEVYSSFLPILIATPIIALMVGFISILFKENAISALSDMTFSVFASVTVATPALVALPKFLCTKKLSEKKCAVVGDASENECAKIDSVIFDDSEAVEVIKKVEIKPDKNADLKKTMRMATRVLSALGGPMASLFPSDVEVQDRASISIISVCDNGIELYMDSSVHVHIGDSDFFENCGIKIKTDGKIKSYLEAKRCGVLYIALNRIPKLGYIVSEKIRRDFRQTAHELSQYDVKALIKTYDPLINDIYLEQNKLIGNSIGIYKPDIYDDPHKITVSDSGTVMLGDCKSIVYPIAYCRDMLKTHRKNQIINHIISIFGMIAALTLCTVSCFSDSFQWFENSKLVILLLFQICTLIPLIPTLSEIFKNNKTGKKQNYEENK